MTADTRSWASGGPTSQTVAQHYSNMGSASRVCHTHVKIQIMVLVSEECAQLVFVHLKYSVSFLVILKK